MNMLRSKSQFYFYFRKAVFVILILLFHKFFCLKDFIDKKFKNNVRGRKDTLKASCECVCAHAGYA